MQNFMKTILSGVQTWTKGKIKESTADWNQNDSSADSFIKNKTHYEEEIQKVILEEQTIEGFALMEEPLYAVVDAFSIELELNKTYTVIWDGASYNLEFKEAEGLGFLGNENYVNMQGGGNIPFALIFAGDIFLVTESTETSHTIFITTPETIIHKLDPKFIPEDAIGAQPDWNQNDPEAKDYVKNRIGYMKVSDTPYISEQTITEYYDFNDVYQSSLPYDSFEFVEGQSYVVYWDGVSYSVTGQYYEDYSSYWYLGNSSIHQYMSAVVDNGMPFLIIKEYEPEYGTYWQVWTKDNNPHTFSVYEVEAHKIDMALLPNTSPLVINDVYYDGTESVNITTVGRPGTGEYSEVFNSLDETSASGDYSHAEGWNTIAKGAFQHVSGKSNISDKDFITKKTILNSTKQLASSSNKTQVYYCDSYTFDETTGIFTLTPINLDSVWQNGVNNHSIATLGGTVYAIYGAPSGKIMYSNENDTTQKLAYTSNGAVRLNKGSVEHTSVNTATVGGQYIQIVGNGTSSARSNAHTLDWEGNAWFAGDVYVGSTSGTNKDEGSVKLATVNDVNSILEQVEALNKVKDFIVLKDIEDGRLYKIQMKNGNLISSLTGSLEDFTYTTTADGDYQLTSWKETLGGEPSTEMLIPDGDNIIL